MADRDPLSTEREGPNWKRWAIGLVLLVLAIFVAQNSQKVEVDFIFAETETPLIFALLLATVLGAVLGWLAPKFRRDRD